MYVEEEQGRGITGGWREVVRCGTSALCVCAPNTLDVGGISWRKDDVDFMPEPKTMANNATLGGCFRAKMTFPPNYPLYPPKMKFETPIFHPNGKFTTIRGTIRRLTSY